MDTISVCTSTATAAFLTLFLVSSVHSFYLPGVAKLYASIPFLIFFFAYSAC
ncbi:uncharacterized protein G2W53_007448 [Senna tora]|uniref:Uncharacterized protein n=1 Tax=Senna tora TaxID=362788 RepID=A0A835CEY0_9FABA|nr:uncharacterized protein G2W53_007448 [Senna tora]